MQGFFEAALLAVTGQSELSARGPPPSSRHRVCLLISDMGFPPIPGVGRAVHSSIIVDDIEYEFSGGGIIRANGPKSHDRFRGHPQVIDMGYTRKSGHSMVLALLKDFPPRSYDLLRKNCNTFTDCALYYLVGQRMDDQHRALEKIGATLNQYTSIISMTFSGYAPNSNADAFNTQRVIDDIQRHSRSRRSVEGGGA